MVYGCGDVNYKDRLSLLNFPSLEEQKVRGNLIETFMLLKGRHKLDFRIFFKLSMDSKVRGHIHKIVKNSFRLDVRINFFSNRVVDAWNELPRIGVDAETVIFFTTRLNNFNASWKRNC